MGNISFRARCDPLRQEVLVDLRNYGAPLSFKFDELEGRMYFDFKLGQRILSVGDFIGMARSEVPVTARIEVNVGKQIRLRQVKIGPEALKRLQAGRSEPIMTQDSGYQLVQRLDTEMGMVAVEVRVVADVVGLVSVDKVQGWLNREKSYVVGKAEGNVQVFVRSRFESSGDRIRRVFQWFVMGAVVVVNLAVVNAIRFVLQTDDRKRLPAPSDSDIYIPATSANKPSSSSATTSTSSSTMDFTPSAPPWPYPGAPPSGGASFTS